MSKHDLRARSIYHHKRESIDAYLAVVFAALAVSHWIEHHTGWTIKKLVRTLRRYRTVQINTGNHILTAEDLLPDHLRQVVAAIHTEGAHQFGPSRVTGRRRAKTSKRVELVACTWVRRFADDFGLTIGALSGPFGSDRLHFN
jgi:hypothetical protein